MEPRRGVLPLGAVPFSGSAMNIFDPQGPIAAADEDDFDRLCRDHAGHRGADHRRDPRLRILVSRSPTPARRIGPIGPIPDASSSSSGRSRRSRSSCSAASPGSARISSIRRADVEGTGSPVSIQVVSLDWKWLFIYPDQRIATVNALTVPVGAPLRFRADLRRA